MLQHPTLWTLWWVLTWGGLGCVSHQLLLTRHWITHLGVTQVSTQPSQGSLPSQKGGAHTNTASHLVCHPSLSPDCLLLSVTAGVLTVMISAPVAQCYPRTAWATTECRDGSGQLWLCQVVSSHYILHRHHTGWTRVYISVCGHEAALGPTWARHVSPQPVFSLRVSDTICPRLSKCPHLCSNQPPTV